MTHYPTVYRERCWGIIGTGISLTRMLQCSAPLKDTFIRAFSLATAEFILPLHVHIEFSSCLRYLPVSLLCRDSLTDVTFLCSCGLSSTLKFKSFISNLCNFYVSLMYWCTILYIFIKACLPVPDSCSKMRIPAWGKYDFLKVIRMHYFYKKSQ